MLTGESLPVDPLARRPGDWRRHQSSTDAWWCETTAVGRGNHARHGSSGWSRPPRPPRRRSSAWSIGSARCSSRWSSGCGRHASGVGGWRPAMGRAIVNAVSVLVIACPCALGLATPPPSWPAPASRPSTGSCQRRGLAGAGPQTGGDVRQDRHAHGGQTDRDARPLRLRWRGRRRRPPRGGARNRQRPSARLRDPRARGRARRRACSGCVVLQGPGRRRRGERRRPASRAGRSRLHGTQRRRDVGHAGARRGAGPRRPRPLVAGGCRRPPHAGRDRVRGRTQADIAGRHRRPARRRPQDRDDHGRRARRGRAHRRAARPQRRHRRGAAGRQGGRGRRVPRGWARGRHGGRRRQRCPRPCGRRRRRRHGGRGRRRRRGGRRHPDAGDPRLVWAAIDLSRRTVITIRRGLFWAFAYNLVGIPLAAMGVLSPVFGAPPWRSPASAWCSTP